MFLLYNFFKMFESFNYQIIIPETIPLATIIIIIGVKHTCSGGMTLFIILLNSEYYLMIGAVNNNNVMLQLPFGISATRLRTFYLFT